MTIVDIIFYAINHQKADDRLVHNDVQDIFTRSELNVPPQPTSVAELRLTLKFNLNLKKKKIKFNIYTSTFEILGHM